MRLPSPGCSDSRAERARQGALSADEWQEHSAHLAVCADCRVTWQVMIDFEQSAAPAPGDELRLGRAAKLALAGSRDRRVRPLRAGAAAAITLLIAGLASGAILLQVRQTDIAFEKSEPAHPARRRVRKAPVSAAISSEPGAESGTLPAPALAPVPPASAPTPALRPTVARPIRTRPGPDRLAATHDIHASPAPQASEDAPSLFSRAVAEREQGRAFAAMATFRALQARYPGSPQAMLSLVSLGDLALDTGDGAAALAAFDQYLAAAPSGALAPEALAGRGRALSALGRFTEAGAVSRELTRRFPDSPYVGRPAGTKNDTP